ncbi:MAG: hypothetical protein GX567_13640, partial [Clostridia bacterium]|nr:hypothetical protein [Clostridia bacterium]
DTRMDAEKCGWVTGSVEQIDFSQITAQFNTFFALYEANIQTRYAEYLRSVGSLETLAQTAFDDMSDEFEAYEDQQKEDFEAWVETIKDILDGNVAGNLLLLIEQKMQKVTVATVGGKLSLVIEDGLNMALAGFTAKDTTFNQDGTITEEDAAGNIKTTTFVSQSVITEEYQLVSGSRYTKTTTFNPDGSITERIIENE